MLEEEAGDRLSRRVVVEVALLVAMEVRRIWAETAFGRRRESRAVGCVSSLGVVESRQRLSRYGEIVLGGVRVHIKIIMCIVA